MDLAQISTIVLAAAGAIQAIAAVIIIALTWHLARTANEALAESARQREVATKALGAAAKQAEVAEKAMAAASRQAELAEKALAESAKQTEAATAANVEARRQRHLAAVPVLDVAYTGTRSTESGIWSDFAIKNTGPAAALQVQLVLFGLTSGHESTNVEAAHSRKIPVLGAGHEIGVECDMRDIRNFPSRPGQPPPPAHVLFSHDWLRVNVECRGLLGAKVIQRYDWAANFPDGPWQLREVEIVPDPQDPGWVQRL